jgi:hypothetical protein
MTTSLILFSPQFSWSFKAIRHQPWSEFRWPNFTPLETRAIYGGDAINESFVPLIKGGL